MTIAMVYVTDEGIVLGADSTSSAPCDIGLHYFNFNQKVFEIGENSTLGMVTWGLGSLSPTSYRTLIARLSDQLSEVPPVNVLDVAKRWSRLFWEAYDNHSMVARWRSLNQKYPYVEKALPVLPNSRSQAEEDEFRSLFGALGVGFCVAGYVPSQRVPEAFQIFFEPLAAEPEPVRVERFSGWGVPNLIMRLIFGWDHNLRRAIIDSGKWSGDEAELDQLLNGQAFAHGLLPIRDAVDFVHACIYSTIKGMKFSNMAQVCGGPIEVAVITTDRSFRWVRHKPWDAAINDGVLT